MTLRDEIKSLLEAPAMNVDDVRTLLRVDHDDALQVARDMVDAEDAEARRALLRQLLPMLATHAQAARCTVYESLRQLRGVDGARNMADVRQEEHRSLDERLGWLAKSRKSGSDEWQLRAKELLALLVLHVEAEQVGMFRLMGEHFNDADLAALGRRFLAAKARAAGLQAGSPAGGRNRGAGGMGAAV